MSAPQQAGLGDRAKALVDEARDKGAEVLDDFKRSDRYFKMRAGVIATWCLISIVTIWNACPAQGPRNELGAEVKVLKEAMIGGAQLMVRNESADLWTNVTLTVNNEWHYEERTIRPHDRLVVSIAEFKNATGSASETLKPKTVSIDCDQGRFTTTVDF